MRDAYLISDALPFGRLWYGEPDAASNAVDYAKFFSRSHDAVIRVYDAAGNVTASIATRVRVFMFSFQFFDPFEQLQIAQRA
jgi:hypothetical protein